MTEDEKKKYGLKPYCTCLSGLYREPQYDARGIFLCYTCSKCENEKLSTYRPDVLSNPNYWHDEPIE